MHEGQGADLRDLPPLDPEASVSVVIPARWAEATIAGCLASVLPQLRDGDELVVVAADASSAEAALAVGDPRVRIVDNPDLMIAPALNRGIAATDRPVVLRADAQSRLPDGYRDRVVQLLSSTGASVTGGRQVPRAGSGFGAAVAAAMASPLGHGGAGYRSGAVAGPVDTVYLGTFRRDVLERVGGYDETFLTNEDAELNERVRRAGGTVWLDPTLDVEYLPRADVRALARQFRGYGRGRARTARVHRGSLRPRQLAAPLLVLGLAATSLLAVLAPLGGLAAPLSAWTVGPLGVLLTGYGAAVGLGARAATTGRSARTVEVALALVTMHLAWGIGFLGASLRLGGPASPRGGQDRSGQDRR
jgi:GT2 family glycosyltransferase